MTARYRPKRTKIGILTATTARYAGQSLTANAGWPSLRLEAAHSVSGIITASAQSAMTRLAGLGNSTVCRAKSTVLSTVFKPKMTLPDAYSPAGDALRFSVAGDKDFFYSLPLSVPNFLSESPSAWQVYAELCL